MLRDLYATPPPDFVATRNDLVKGLRKDKRRDEATALAALRRPGWDDWALNAVAASDAAVVEGFAAAAADVREAQSAAIEGRDGPDIRGALKDLREHSAALVRRAEDALGEAGRQPVTGEINARLTQVATNDVAVAQLLAGILGSGDTAPKDLFGGLEPGDRAARPPRPAKQPAKRAAAKAAPPSAPAPDPAAERAARAEQERRKEALAEANREHRAAVKARQRADAEVAKADAAVERARAALAAADEARAAVVADRDDAIAAADAAEAAVEAARAALDE
ncbi:MAG TPA: hypothetical protein VFT09_09210 [Ilumatobacteraceae bacterium]|nr:hypothetical protein [Ilumatobacteraceae bacterium]